MKNILFKSDKIDNILKRIAHEIIEKNNNLNKLCIIGIKSRGDILSDRIVDKIYQLSNVKVKCGSIDVTFYRDDFLSNLGSHKIGPSNIDFDISGLHVILIDDVLYSGRTIRAAMDEIFSFGRPGSIKVGVLVDRGHRQLPIKASYIGKNIPTSNQEQVHVYLKEIDQKEEVVLIKHNKS